MALGWYLLSKETGKALRDESSLGLSWSIFGGGAYLGSFIMLTLMNYGYGDIMF